MAWRAQGASQADVCFVSIQVDGGGEKRNSCLTLVVVAVQLLSRIRLLRPHGLYPAKLHCPWGFSVKHTGVGCQFLL